jgi:hypothetical protein
LEMLERGFFGTLAVRSSVGKRSSR